MSRLAGTEPSNTAVRVEPAAPDPVVSPWRHHLPFAVWALLALACVYTLQLARAFLFPIVLAVILSLVLSPVVHALKRLRIPTSLGAALVLAALLLGTAWAVYALSGPAADWMARAPASLKVVEQRGRRLLAPFKRFSRTAAQVENLTVMDASQVQQVEVRGPGIGASVFGNVQELVSSALVVVPLLYLLLASGDSLLRGLVRALPRLRDKKRAVDITRETQRQVSAYLFAVTLINFGLGVAVAAAMWAIGLPNAILWGILAAILSYVPLFGGVIFTGILALAGLLTFESLPRALLPAAAFLVLNFIQDYVATPLVLGRRLTLDPIILFVSVVFWWWMWGAVGGLLAVPMLAAFRIFCQHSETLRPIGEVIGGDSTRG